MSSISRRSFLKGAAASLAGVAVTGLVGCSAQGASDPGVESTKAPEAMEPIIQEVIKTEYVYKEVNPQDDSYDSFTTEYTHLFEPIQVGSMKLRNRIIKSSAGSDTTRRAIKEVTQSSIDYYGRIADGGAALVLVEVSMPIEPKLAERVHAGGAYIGQQSSMSLKDTTIDEATYDQIQDSIKTVTGQALKFKAAGYDCVDLKGTNTTGPIAFLSRRLNHREDEYGCQTIENRARIFTEAIKSIKEACGQDFGVLCIINFAEENDMAAGDNDKFITMEEAKEIAKLLEAAGADAVQLRVSTTGMEANWWAPDVQHAGYKIDGNTGYGTQFDYSVHFDGYIDGTHYGAAGFLPAVREMKKAVSIPVGCAGYMDPRTTPDLINNALANGEIDLIFMNRPLTVDPELPNKLKEGRRDEVAPCTRCLLCHDHTLGIAECCRVNATTQFAYRATMPEGYDPLPAETVKNVMVVGGGPAGMEAARIAAERGHKVTLYEKNGYLGGMLPFAHAVKGPHERLMDLQNYQVRQLEVKGVTVVTEQEVDAAFIDAQKPDAVILATGGLRDIRFAENSVKSPNCFSIENIMTGEIGEKVVILGAGAQAIDTAFYLLAQHKKVEIVHSGVKSEIDKEQSAWYQQFLPPYLYAHGVKIWNEATVNEIVDGGVSITMDNGLTRTLTCDTVIECWDMLPNQKLLEEIQDKYEVVAIGDCKRPNGIQRAIYTGNIAGRNI